MQIFGKETLLVLTRACFEFVSALKSFNVILTNWCNAAHIYAPVYINVANLEHPEPSSEKRITCGGSQSPDSMRRFPNPDPGK